MSNFVIITDSTTDLPKSYYKEKNVPVVSLSYMMDGVTYEDMNGLSGKELFEKIREGAMPTTSQINPEQAREALEPFAKEGKDIIYIAFTSGLSGSYNSVRMAAEELSEEYPDRKIVAIDSLCASMGEGLLLYKAVELKEQGKSFEEIVDWVENNKLNICHDVTIDDLHHLHRGGRVSKTSAVVGSIIKIKPMIHVNEEGKLIVIGKERGRKKAMLSLVERMEQKQGDFKNDVVMIVHGDVEEDAEFLKKEIESRFGITNIITNCIGSVIGSHTGPGVIAIFYMGDRSK
jgi:DegV family protein with EDD domain